MHEQLLYTEGSCPGVLYHASGQYSKVCGRVIGLQFRSPSIFENEHLTIDEAYVEGVSITHGRNPCKHIWSYMLLVLASKMAVLILNVPVLIF